MEPATSSQSSSSSAQQGADGGRVAVPEIAELLHLQRPAAAVAAAAVVLIALGVTLVAPGLLPANVVTGALVGVVAVGAGLATAVLLDGRDPVLRGPRHLRRDGHVVLARMAGPDAAAHGVPVLDALHRRMEGRDHLAIALVGTGTDPSALAAALGRGAAADGLTSLVVDLRSTRSPGVADVGAGTVKLGEAADLADDRPYAWIGAGLDADAAVEATVAVARRPPRDLRLLLVVAPEAASLAGDLLASCDSTLLLVGADTQQRSMVTARMDALARVGARPEAVVVGGLHVADAPVTTLPGRGAAPDGDAEQDVADAAEDRSSPTDAEDDEDHAQDEDVFAPFGADDTPTETAGPEPGSEAEPEGAAESPPPVSPFARSAQAAAGTALSTPGSAHDEGTSREEPEDDARDGDAPRAAVGAHVWSRSGTAAPDRTQTSPWTSAEIGDDTDFHGMTAPDALATAAALERLASWRAEAEG